MDEEVVKTKRKVATCRTEEKAVAEPNSKAESTIVWNFIESVFFFSLLSDEV